MSTNKYRRRRAMRKPTAGLKYQNEPIQGPLQKVEKTSSLNDLGREDARRITEANNPNTRHIDRPKATTSKAELKASMLRYEVFIRDAQLQVLGDKAVPPLKPLGKFPAPSIPSQSPLVFKGASVSYQSPLRANLVTALTGIASEMLVEPLSDAISDNIIFPLMEKALGRDIPTSAEIRQRQELERQNQKQVRSTKEAAVNAHPQTLVEASVSPLNPVDDSVQTIEDSAPLQTLVEEPLETHSPTPADDERNREYLIRRAALGDNPTQEEMNADVAFGLAQHKINFPHLYR